MDIQKMKIDSLLDEHLTVLLYAADILGDEEKGEQILSARHKIRDYRYIKSDFTVHPKAFDGNFDGLMKAIDKQYYYAQMLYEYTDLYEEYKKGKINYYNLYDLILKLEFDKIEKEASPGMGEFINKSKEDFRANLGKILNELKK